MLVSQNGFSALQQEALAKKLGIRELRVFFEMLANTGYDNVVMVSQADIGRLTRMDMASVSRSSKALLDQGFVERLNNRRGWYRINPKFAWKGGGEEHRASLAREAEDEYLEKFEQLKEIG